MQFWVDLIPVSYMPDDATEGVAEHSSWLQSMCMPQLHVAFMFLHALVLNVIPRRDEGLGKPCALIEAI